MYPNFSSSSRQKDNNHQGFPIQNSNTLSNSHYPPSKPHQPTNRYQENSTQNLVKREYGTQPQIGENTLPQKNNYQSFTTENSNSFSNPHYPPSKPHQCTNQFQETPAPNFVKREFEAQPQKGENPLLQKSNQQSISIQNSHTFSKPQSSLSKPHQSTNQYQETSTLNLARGEFGTQPQRGENPLPQKSNHQSVPIQSSNAPSNPHSSLSKSHQLIKQYQETLTPNLAKREFETQPQRRESPPPQKSSNAISKTHYPPSQPRVSTNLYQETPTPNLVEREFGTQPQRGENTLPQKKKLICHFFSQFGDCKRGRTCHFFHLERAVGACIEVECPFCDMTKKLQYCNIESSHRYCDKQHEQNQDVNQQIGLVLKALDDQLNLVNTYKDELSEMLKAGDETKEMVEILKQLLEQRSDFINVVNEKIATVLSKPEDARYLTSIEDGAKLFSKGRPFNSVLKSVKFGQEQNEKKSSAENGKKTQVSCRYYEVGNCKEGDNCKFHHSKRAVGASLEAISNLFEDCFGINCSKLYQKQHTPNQQVNQVIDLVLRALDDQLKIICKCQNELQDMCKIESETKDALETKLAQLIEQRSYFIRVVRQKISKTLTNPNDTNNLWSVEVEVKIFSRGLPAYSVCQTIKEELYKDDKRFCSVLGETGSGKTTQVPQFLYQEVKHTKKKILCVQPRKIAAMSLAARVAEELGVTLGEQVGFEVGPGKKPTEGQYTESKYTNDTKILFMTESMLLKKLIIACKAPEKKFSFFRSVRAIVLDEVHERSLLSDLIFGILKSLEFPEDFKRIKIFLASATVNVGLFRRYFDDCRAIEIPGRTFPVQIKYKPMFEENYIEGTVEVLKQVIKHKRSGNSEYQGHVLVFLTSNEEMEDVQSRIMTAFPTGDLEEEYVVSFLHGKLGSEEQRKIFDAADPRNKIILATKIAESSITINGVRIVIDSGFDKDSYYDSQKGINVLELDWISQASAKQRMGRAGRTAPGICFRLYSEDTFQKLEVHKKPEIAKINLEAALLKILGFGLNPQTFPFLEPPGKEVIESTMTTLGFLGALDGQNKLTPTGKLMMEMSTEPKKTKTIILANQFGCFDEILQVISMESYERSIYYLPKDKKEREVAVSRRLTYERYQSDHLDYLYTFQTWLNLKSYQEKKAWCQQKYIKGPIMESVKQMYKDLQFEITTIKKKNPELEHLLEERARNSSNKIEESILKCLLASSIISLARFSGLKQIGYVNIMNGTLFHIHIASGQKNYFPQIADTEKELAIYSKMDNFNGLNKAKIVSFIKSDWLQDRSLISNEMLQKILAGAQENYKFERTTVELPSWSIKLFKKLFKDRINQWIESKRGNNRQSIQMIQPNDTTICFVHSNDLSKEVENLYATLKRELDENVLSDNLIYPMENTNYTPIITQGLGVSEILFAGEFITVSYQVNGKRSKSQMMSLLGLRESEIHYIMANENQQKTTGDVRFYNKRDAERFYDNFKRKEEFNLEKVFPYNKKVHMFDNCKIKATFCLAKPLCMAKITFENSYDAEQVMGRLRANPSIDDASVKVQDDKKNPNAFYIKNLSPYTDEQILKNYVTGALSLPKISVHREVNDREIQSMTKDEKVHFNSLFTQYLSPEEIQNMYFTFKPSRKYKNMSHALITMPSRAIAQKVMDEYNGKKGVFGTQRFRIKIKNSLTLKINQNIFKVMNLVILKKIEELQKDQPHISIRINNPQKTNQDPSFFYKVKITSSDNSINRVIATKIEALTRGEHFSISSQKEKISLFGSVMMEFYPRVEQYLNQKKPNSIYIAAEPRSKKLTFYSPFPEVRATAKVIIQNALNQLETTAIIDLKNYNIKRVKAFIDQTNKDFPNLHDSTKAFDLNLDYRSKKVFVKADTNFIEAFKRSIEPFIVPETNQNPEACPICFESLTNDCCILYKCGHRFCKDDLKRCLESQEFKPHLECPLPDCQKKILTFGDIKSVLSVDSMNKIIEDHVKTFISTQHQLYRNCPTPDCNHIFKVGQKEYHCQGCFENYCILKLDDIHRAHPDVNCTQFKSSNQVEKQFQELIAKGDIKMTKCCNIPMVKNDGCNHMTCTQCKRHFCWLCLEVFPSGNETGQHLMSKHGGYR